MTSISAIVHARNSASTLEACLRSIRWCDEIVVIDMESIDETRAIADAFDARVESCPPQPWSDALRNAFVETCQSDWILVIDSDEYLAEDAEAAIRSFTISAEESVGALALPRFNYFFGAPLLTARWYPDHQVRVVRKGRASWKAKHHVGAIIEGTVVSGSTDGPHIHHVAYSTIAEFAQKQMLYAVTDDYDEAFDPGAYVEGALRTWISTENLDDRARALELIMAWNDLYRCLLHWDARRELGEPLPEVLNSPPWFPMSLNGDHGHPPLHQETQANTVGPIAKPRLRRRVVRRLARFFRSFSFR